MSGLTDAEFARRAAELEWILCDVDGVLTDGGLYYDRRGHGLLRFDVQDGLGLKLAQRAGIKVGLLSGRGGPPVDHRARELGLDAVLTDARDKADAFEKFLSQQGTTARRTAYVGDDLPDLVVLARCGLTFAPDNAVPEVKTVVHRILGSVGGHGAAREMVEAILRARGEWDRVLGTFTFDD